MDSRFSYFKLCRVYNNGPLQLAIPGIQNRRTGRQKWRWNMTNKGNWDSKFCMSCFSCPSATYALQQGGFVPRVRVRASCNRPICSKCRLKAIFPGVGLEKKFWILDPKIYTNPERAKTSLTVNRLFGVSLMWMRNMVFISKASHLDLLDSY